MSKKSVVNNLTYMIDDEILKQLLSRMSELQVQITQLRSEVALLSPAPLPADHYKGNNVGRP